MGEQFMNWLQKISGQSYNGTLYHGSNKEFGAFDLSFAGARDWGDYGVGIYASLNPNVAILYARDAAKYGGGEPVVYKVSARLQNVATYDELIEAMRSVNVPEEKDVAVTGPSGLQSRPELDSRSITRRMIDNGFDAARVNAEFVIYEPSALKIERIVSMEDAQFLPPLH